MAMQVPRSMNVINFVKACDATVGILSVLREPSNKRRDLYGRAGDFRARALDDEWGIIEYRTPSNYWLKSKDLMKEAFTLFQKVPNYLHMVPIAGSAQAIINGGYKGAAREHMSYYGFKDYV